ncbi:ANTAR domain-containing response regulator [Acetivibrio cellulolyticus]|uniref:ANTAR domain-containing response regulator n=1 Tax=Acetivibrio cellulolyticus TaxID=35830 RepID=UPI0001E2F57A|nr:ANTAR domain-containing protein [Acetivibrio cellulolyticus]
MLLSEGGVIMESARILVAMENDSLINKFRTILLEGGYEVIDQAKEENECLGKIRSLKPDITILDYKLISIDGSEFAKVVSQNKLCDVILVSDMLNCEEKSSIDYIKAEYDFVVITKPLKRDSFINTINLVIKNRKKIMQLETEIEELKKTLDMRKDIERAKGLLMKHLKLTEDEAFRRIQKQSMDKEISMKEIAKAIILTYDL